MATCLWSISNKMWFEFLVKKSSSELLNKQIKTTDAVNRLYVARAMSSRLCSLLQAVVSDSRPVKEPPARHPSALPEEMFCGTQLHHDCGRNPGERAAHPSLVIWPLVPQRN